MAYLSAQLDAVEGSMPFRVVGRVQGISGMTIEASDLTLPLGSLCRIDSFGDRTSDAEVIGFRQDRTLLMPLSGTSGVARGDAIEGVSAAPRVWCSDQLLGRVLDGFGRPVDGKGPLRVSQSRRIDGRGVAPLERRNIRQHISTSVRAIDGLLTCGQGQRMGIFSGPGVGKSTLLSQIARHTSADVSVVALIGERGREVQEFLENSLGQEGLKRCVVIVSTSDDAPLLRVRAAKVACTVAEYFRDRGLHVLLMMDSLTRMCQAQRQIGLAAREPPATKGFPPSVFALLPEILERAGNTATGSVTGFYTVLVEGDDHNEPIADTARSILDGHIVLTRKLATVGHFPAVDVLESISRVATAVVPPAQMADAREVRRLMGALRDVKELIEIGAYQAGSDPLVDRARQLAPSIEAFLQQPMGESTPAQESWAWLQRIVRTA